jgi:hypothetical protein
MGDDSRRDTDACCLPRKFVGEIVARLAGGKPSSDAVDDEHWLEAFKVVLEAALHSFRDGVPIEYILDPYGQRFLGLAQRLRAGDSLLSERRATEES